MYLTLFKKYYREILLVLLLTTIFFMGRSLLATRGANARLETQVANSKVEFEKYQDGIVQAKNTNVLTQEELHKQLSESLQLELLKQKQQILASLTGEMQVGFEDIRNKIGHVDPQNPKLYRYSDTVMKSIEVNTQDPQSPLFSYSITPFEITLQGSLNFDTKSGTTRFWTQPTIQGAPRGIAIGVSKMEFSPSEEFNTWVTGLRGKTVYTPIMPKWTLSGTFGREWSRDITGGYRNVGGLDVTRNFQNGLGVGAGYIGSTVYIKASYSFGK